MNNLLVYKVYNFYVRLRLILDTFYILNWLLKKEKLEINKIWTIVFQPFEYLLISVSLQVTPSCLEQERFASETFIIHNTVNIINKIIDLGFIIIIIKFCKIVYVGYVFMSK